MAKKVTPFAGVWIEIELMADRTPNPKSPPSRGCGLKYIHYHFIILSDYVTPFAGVWIEISRSGHRKSGFESSPPSRGCGLKYDDQFPPLFRPMSPPSRGCGLKCIWFPKNAVESIVTPFAGVWIEIRSDAKAFKTRRSHPLRGGVD